MILSTQELNELLYCVARTIAEDCGSWNTNLRKELFEKIYKELEIRNSPEENNIN
jgi:hypothetical protein